MDPGANSASGKALGMGSGMGAIGFLMHLMADGGAGARPTLPACRDMVLQIHGRGIPGRGKKRGKSLLWPSVVLTLCQMLL